MAKKEKKDYEKPELTQLGDDQGKLSESDLEKVSGGGAFNGCSTGYGDENEGCEIGYSAKGFNGCCNGVSYVPTH